MPWNQTVKTDTIVHFPDTTNTVTAAVDDYFSWKGSGTNNNLYIGAFSMLFDGTIAAGKSFIMFFM